MMKYRLILPVLALMALGACQTTKEANYGELEQLFRSLSAKQITAEKISAILKDHITGTDIKDYEVLSTLHDFYDRQDEQKIAFRYSLQMAIHTHGNFRDQLTLACRYWTGKGINTDAEQSLIWFTKAARNGSLEARLFLSSHYKNHQAFPELGPYWETRAYALAQKKLSREQPTAQNVEGYIADSLKYNACPAIADPLREHYQQLAIKSAPQTAENLFNIYETKLKNKEAKTADMLDLLLEAAKQGHLKAHIRLATFYEDEKNSAYSKQEAIKWYLKAARLNPGRFYQGHYLAEHLWKLGKRSDAAFWYMLKADGYRGEKREQRALHYINQLTPDEHRDYMLMYENWAYNGKLP
ncbi:SEL1-like repeat protein [Terasakiella sp. SH-1]|uniref:SEL1-like repeat protein n=1 Tax=Terasakiella sp. SH-1 TaxID=2560057 RepID=UPI0010744A34|nr:SEL1-like repeat protein [Terasakiella sp. SH-1]